MLKRYLDTHLMVLLKNTGRIDDKQNTKNEITDINRSSEDIEFKTKGSAKKC